MFWCWWLGLAFTKEGSTWMKVVLRVLGSLKEQEEWGNKRRREEGRKKKKKEK